MPSARQHLREGTEPVVAGMRRRISLPGKPRKASWSTSKVSRAGPMQSPLRGEQLLLDREELDAPEEESSTWPT